MSESESGSLCRSNSAVCRTNCGRTAENLFSRRMCVLEEGVGIVNSGSSFPKGLVASVRPLSFARSWGLFL